MDCSKHVLMADRRGRFIGALLLGLYLIGTLPSLALAQPVATGPAELSRWRAWTDYRTDWSATDRYDFGTPVSVDITIEGLLLPQEGNAELLFRTTAAATEHLPFLHGPDHIYHATLQLAREVRRLGLSERDLRRGLRARLRGWPATPENHSPSLLLVDEILLPGNRGSFSLHHSPRMRAFREQASGNAP